MAGVKVAGVKVADVKVASVKVASVKVASVEAAPVDRGRLAVVRHHVQARIHGDASCLATISLDVTGLDVGTEAHTDAVVGVHGHLLLSARRSGS